MSIADLDNPIDSNAVEGISKCIYKTSTLVGIITLYNEHNQGFYQQMFILKNIMSFLVV